ncbi:MAG TPA: hypothetical protein VF006_31970 [Longimicrobium sp.]
MDESTVKSLLNWFRQHNFERFEEARRASLSIGIPIETVLASLGFSSDERGYAEFRQEIESFNSLDERRRRQYVQVTQTINPGVVNAHLACLTRAGLHTWLETTQDPFTFRIAARFSSDGDRNSAIIRNIDVIPRNIICGRSFVPSFFERTRFGGKRVTGATLRAACIRADSSAVTVTINANVDPQGGGSLNLPRIPPPLQTIIEDPIVEREVTTDVREFTFVPPHTRGDADFDGNGPSVVARVDLRLNNERTVLFAQIFMNAEETESDHTQATGQTRENDPNFVVFRAPSGFSIKEIRGPQSDEMRYIDGGHGEVSFRPADIHAADCGRLSAIFRRICEQRKRDTSNNGLVDQWFSVGDTDGDEAGTRTNVRVRLRPIRLLIEGRERVDRR